MKVVGADSITPNIRVFNKAEIIEAFEVTSPTLDAWVRKGCPVLQRGARGVAWEFDVFEVFKWKNDIGQQEETDDPEQLSPKERLDYYRGCRERDNYRREQGELIHADDVIAHWTRVILSAKGRLMALPMRLAPELLTADDMKQAEEILKAGLLDALEELSEGNGT